MSLKDYRVDGKKKFTLSSFPTDAGDEIREKIEQKTEKNLALMAEYQDKLYADSKESVVVILQALDAAGKDSTIKKALSSVNPQGISVISFKRPSEEELAHDFLWRAHKALPRRGHMAVFNRSYYEDVLVVRVHEIQKTYSLPERCFGKNFFERRYREIKNYEEYLYENGYRVVKIFLNISKKEQKKRLLERIDDESKNWKFESADLKEREKWDDYMKAFEDAINGTATKRAPWYIVPADAKWYARYLVTEAVLEALKDCKPKYPQLGESEQKLLRECRAQLENDGGEYADG